jgi:hypothetical protein
LLGCFLVSSISLIKKARVEAPVTLKVYDPTGAFEVSQTFAPRLADLNGKTICELSDNMWEDERTFPVIGRLIQKNFPTAKIISYEKFPNGLMNSRNSIDSDNTVAMVKAAGCQAVIVGNAG